MRLYDTVIESPMTPETYGAQAMQNITNEALLNEAIMKSDADDRELNLVSKGK